VAAHFFSFGRSHYKKLGRTVISIKKYLDLDSSELRQYHPPTTEELLADMSGAYRSALDTMGNSGLLACPATGPDLRRDLSLLAEGLLKAITPALIHETEGQVEQHLQLWGELTAKYLEERAGDVKEILLTLAHAAESIAERDQRNAAQFSEFTKRLHALAKLDDLPQLRAAVARGAAELRSCVEKMEQDSRESVAVLQTKVAGYQEKLEEAEQRASRDALTGLDNRHAVEEKVQRLSGGGKRFCVLILDLNKFKQVNDNCGHEAGDDLLRQFSAELRSVSRSTDVVGRWGGDEFIVVLDGTLTDAQLLAHRIRQWVFGGYTSQSAPGGAKINMSAAIGATEWQPGETFKEVVARADALMYEQKKCAAQEGQEPQTALA
jgi:diguanylate cyclase (GGDEF)-like protein